jgi:flagellar protein FliO/FliZ
MKHTISYALFVMVLSLGSSVSLAEDAQLPLKTTSENTINQSTIDTPSDEKPARKLLTATSASDAKTTKPSPGEFSVMSQPDVGSGIIQVTLGLFVVLLIIAAAAWFTRRFGHFQSTTGGAMRIIGGLHLGTRERLVVVQVGEEQLLLGVAPGRVSTLHVLAKPLHQDEPTSNRARQVSGGAFLDKLNTVLKKGRQ